MNLKEETFFGSQCMFVCDQITLKILDVNDHVVRKFGRPRSEILGKTLTELGSEVQVEERFDVDNELIPLLCDVWEMNYSDGEKCFVQFSSHLINFKGSPAKLIVAHDITAMIESNSVNTRLISSPVSLQNFPLAEIEWNKNLKILRWSQKAEELFGWSQEEAVNQPNLLREFVHPEDLEFVRSELEETLQKKRKNVSLVNRNITKTGDTIYCEWYNSFLFDSKGEIVSIYSLVTDVTARVEAMNRSRRSMQSYRDLFDSISDAIYLVNDKGEIIGANSGLELTYGYKPEDVLTKNYTMLRPPGKFNPDRIFEVKKLGLNESLKFEGWGKKANGELIQTEILVNEGSYFGEDVLIVIERDISERKHSLEELRKREHLFSELFNTSPLGIAMLNQHDEILHVNKGFEKIFGYRDKEITGLELDRIIVPEDAKDQAAKLTGSDEVIEVECQRMTKSGELVDVIIYAIPIVLDGRTIAKYGIYVDITDRKQAEKQVLDSLREKEVLLSEIHHRVKNNLAVITGLLELQSYSAKNEHAQDILQESRMRIHSIALVHEMLYQNEDLSQIEIHRYMKDLTEVVRKTMGTNKTKIDVHFDLDEILLMVTQAIPCGLLLNEVLTNSFKHAFSGREEGKVWVRFKEKGNKIYFTIKDDGVGMDKMNYSNPGPSLGMKLIRTLSKQLGAETEIHTGEGTVFEFGFVKEM